MTAIQNNKKALRDIPESVNVSQSLNNGEKNTMQIIEKLYLQNVNLSKEFNALSEQLPALLEKEKANNKAQKLSSSIVGEDNSLQKELSEAYKLMQSYQKELKTLKTKYGNSATFERYKDLNNTVTVREKELEKLTIEKTTLERTLAEREKAIDNLKKQSGNDVKIPMLAEEIKELKEKLKEAHAHERKLEAEADKDNAQLAKHKEELNKVKESYRYMLDRTGYDTVEDKVRTKPTTKPLYMRNQSKNDRPSISKKEKEEEEELDFNQDNFEKVYSAVKSLRRSEMQKDRNYRQESQELKGRIDALKKGQEEMTRRLTEKEKEANILSIKLRELHRIARYHSIIPLDEEEPTVTKHNVKIDNSKKKLSPLMSPTSAGKLGLSSPSGTFSLKNKLGRLDSLNDLAKNGLLYAGYRKDERGKAVPDGPGDNVGDKELMGNSKPKIIGLKIWHDNRRITGFQATYKSQDGTISEGGLHAKNPHAYKLESFELSGDDYLKEISGFTNKTDHVLECLMLMSAKGETKKILEPNKESKLFKFDINEFEYPSILYGFLKEETPRNFLTKFGVLIASTNVEENLKTGSIEQVEKSA